MMNNNLGKYSLLEIKVNVLGGKPCLKGTRISVDMILEWIASGATIPAIVERYPHVTEEAVVQAIRFAAEVVQNDQFIQVELAS